MSEQQNTESQTEGQENENTQTPEQLEQEEKSILRSRLKTMGKNPSPNASLETLRQQYKDALEGGNSEEAKPVQPMPGTVKQSVGGKKKTLHQILKEKAHKLVRVRITCHNPNKRDLPGEFFSVGNNYMGTIKRYVPFGELTDDGWHIEQAIYDMMKSRQYVDIRTKQDKRTGQISVTTRMAPEFGIEVLEPLTPKQLKDLATAQIAAGTSSVG